MLWVKPIMTTKNEEKKIVNIQEDYHWPPHQKMFSLNILFAQVSTSFTKIHSFVIILRGNILLRCKVTGFYISLFVHICIASCSLARSELLSLKMYQSGLKSKDFWQCYQEENLINQIANCSYIFFDNLTFSSHEPYVHRWAYSIVRPSSASVVSIFKYPF